MTITSFLFQIVGFEEDCKLLTTRLKRLVKKSGRNFAFLYLKESVRLVLRSLAGAPEPRFLAKGIYVSRDSMGLPMLIPKKLRAYLMDKDQYMVKFILTLLSIYRVFPSVQKIKLGTITDPFNGVSRNLDSHTLSLAVADVFGSRSLKLKSMRFIKLETASPYS